MKSLIDCELLARVQRERSTVSTAKPWLASHVRALCDGRRKQTIIVTIFRNRLKPEHQAEYYSYATEIRGLAATMSGFIGQKSFVAEDGERVSIVEFASKGTHQAWRDHPGHRVAQELGRGKFYSEYRVQVCSLERDYSYSISPGNES